MSNPWTQGPWFAGEQIDFGDGTGRVFVTVGTFEADNHFEDAICDIYSENHDDEIQANVRLIAAAPEMAERLPETLRTLGYLREELIGRIEGAAAIKFFVWADARITGHSALLTRIRGEQS